MFLNKNYLIINDKIMMHIKCVLSLLMRLSIYFPFVIVCEARKLAFFMIEFMVCDWYNGIKGDDSVNGFVRIREFEESYTSTEK